MSDGTKISWADATWSPLVGCTKVSAGCDNCYAIRTAHRMTANPNPLVSQAYAGTEAGGEWTGKVNLLANRLDQPLRWRKPRRIFVNAQSDLFHKDVPDDFIARVWQNMGSAPQHTYQVLTKRHARMRSWVRRWHAGDVAEPERWAAVPGFPGYRVSTRGVIIGKRSDTANGLRAEVGEHGHLRVTLHRDGSPRSGERLLVHRVVLEAFTRSARPGEQARHLNGDASDNRLSNLRWGTQRENWNDRRAQGNGRSYAKLSESDVCEIRRRLGAGEAAYSIAADFPVSDTQIRNIARGDQWAPVEAVTYQPGERAVLDCVWLGVSVEDQATAELRIPALLDTPAAVRFLSCEPLLGPMDLQMAVPRPCTCGPGQTFLIGETRAHKTGCPALRWPFPDWVIVGGESGPGARPMHPDWARSLRDQCAPVGVPYFFKQAGSVLAREWGCTGKGTNPDEWPESFPQEYPNA